MIKEYQIEDTVVAYFDGMLNDEDSAELLHRVSVSPEIREIYQEHEAIRGMAYRAARNVSVSPELEEAVFARVAALQEVGREKVLPVAFWTMPRISAMAGAAALIAIGFIAPWRTSDSFVKQVNAPVSASVQGTEMTQGTKEVGSTSPIAEGTSFAVSKNLNGKIGNRNSYSSNAGNLIAEATPVAAISAQVEADPAIQIIPQASESERINMPAIGGEPKTLRVLSGLPDMDNSSMFEVGMTTNIFSSFNTPSITKQNQMISEFALKAAYNFDSRNQIGFRLTRVAFPELQTAPPVELGGYALVIGGMGQTQAGFSGELFYKHRMPINDGLFYVTGSVGGGFYQLGSLLSAEVGLEIPMNDRLISGVSLILSRLHQNGSESAILSGNEPVIYDGPNVFNTLDGRIEYGLSYRF